jgi:hypothetical protein
MNRLALHILFVGAILITFMEGSSLGAEPSGFPPAHVITKHAAQLTSVDSNAAALATFSSTIGPALGLQDAAGTIAAKNIPAKMAKELGVTVLSASAQQLIAALAAWQLADSVVQASDPSAATAQQPAVALPSAAREEWLTANGPWPALPDVLRLLRAQSTQPAGPSERTELALAAHRLALEASQRASALWWNVQGWKDRVRAARGRARLCGTWQWHIHNHQNHQEQKSSMIFPPAGQEKPGMATPAEIVVLGDSVYLRWEMDGRMQEDSLLLIKDGNRIEGSFVNNLGGWGSITGKRTAACQ